MVLSAAESDHLTIEKHHLEQAIAVVGSLEADMPRVFSRIGQDDNSRKASKVRDLVITHKRIELDQLWRYCIDTMGLSEFKTAVAGMVMAKDASQHTDANGKTWIVLKGEEPPVATAQKLTATEILLQTETG